MVDTPGSSFPNASFSNSTFNEASINWKDGHGPADMAGKKDSENTVGGGDGAKFIEDLSDKIAEKLGTAIRIVAEMGAVHNPAGPAPAGGGHGAGSTADAARMAAMQQAQLKFVKNIDDFNEQTKKHLDEIVGSFSVKNFESTTRNLSVNLFGTIVGAIQNPLRTFVANLISGQAAVNVFTKAIREGTEAWESGLGSIADWAKNMLQFGGDYGETARSIKDDPTGYVTSGLGFREYGAELRKMTTSLNRLAPSASSILDTKDQHALLQAQYKLHLQNGMRSGEAFDMASKTAAKQVGFMESIMKNTGLTAKELIAASAKATTLQDAARRGLLDTKEVAYFSAMLEDFRKKGATDFSAAIERMLSNGRDTSMVGAKEFEGLNGMVAAADSFRQLRELIRSGASPEQVEQLKRALIEQAAAMTSGFAKGATIGGLGTENTLAISALAAAPGEEREGPDRWLEGIFNTVGNWLDQNTSVVNWLAVIAGGVGTIVTLMATQQGAGFLKAPLINLAGGGGVSAIGAISLFVKSIPTLGMALFAINDAIEAFVTTAEEVETFEDGWRGWIGQAFANVGPWMLAAIVGGVAIATAGIGVLAAGLVASLAYAAFNLLDSAFGGALSEAIGKASQLFYDWFWGPVGIGGIISGFQALLAGLGTAFTSLWSTLSGFLDKISGWIDYITPDLSIFDMDFGQGKAASPQRLQPRSDVQPYSSMNKDLHKAIDAGTSKPPPDSGANLHKEMVEVNRNLASSLDMMKQQLKELRNVSYGVVERGAMTAG